MLFKAIACFLLGWLVPGLGHITLKKYGRGFIFLGSILMMTAMGLFMGGKIYPGQTENPLTILAFFADMGNGLVYIFSRIFPFGTGTLSSVTFEYGTAYLAGAGLLNYLVALDAYDTAMGRKK